MSSQSTSYCAATVRNLVNPPVPNIASSQERRSHLEDKVWIIVWHARHALRLASAGNSKSERSIQGPGIALNFPEPTQHAASRTSQFGTRCPEDSTTCLSHTCHAVTPCTRHDAEALILFASTGWIHFLMLVRFCEFECFCLFALLLLTAFSSRCLLVFASWTVKQLCFRESGFIQGSR